MQLKCFELLNINCTENDINERLYTALGYWGVALKYTDANKDSNKDAYKVACILESSAFFQVMCPLLQLLSQSKEEYEKESQAYIDMAAYFDRHTLPLQNNIMNGAFVAVPSDADFESYMLKATEYKASLLRTTTQKMRVMGTGT